MFALNKTKIVRWQHFYRTFCKLIWIAPTTTSKRRKGLYLLVPEQQIWTWTSVWFGICRTRKRKIFNRYSAYPFVGRNNVIVRLWFTCINNKNRRIFRFPTLYCSELTLKWLLSTHHPKHTSISLFECEFKIFFKFILLTRKLVQTNYIISSKIHWKFHENSQNAQNFHLTWGTVIWNLKLHEN